ncbi:uncharacterized protein PHALS_04599 [Plasmopara halstedii]|uniref:Uncharacterized protein n=1 Tax=Plasmopara halstedii TaxID=4781 RepID=A0A0P1A9S4_PLAHL|nr:uncharacterized protein PHALS_04599 [Plasmopara halstedii]CEG37149.1 hypothetical protein PHALS_04599 [Plasmopara halstedii]|eukprot:XP_024573518.1 hypothetical protein PHALS_04599 [Plasmopara halstedii]
MQQASATSFFPTAKELSSGVQWFKDHPVLAAAAATAVSVITYLNTLELSETDAERPGDGVDVELAISTRHRRSLSLRRKGSPGVASDSKLSAAVSWCDEHGGSLTQVFEDDTPPCIQLDRSHEDGDTDDEARDGVAESYKNAFQQHKVLTSGLRKSVTQQQLDAVNTWHVLSSSLCNVQLPD